MITFKGNPIGIQAVVLCWITYKNNNGTDKNWFAYRVPFKTEWNIKVYMERVRSHRYRFRLKHF